MNSRINERAQEVQEDQESRWWRAFEAAFNYLVDSEIDVDETVWEQVEADRLEGASPWKAALKAQVAVG